MIMSLIFVSVFRLPLDMFFAINNCIDCDKSGEEDGKANKKEHQLSRKEMKGTVGLDFPL